MTTHRGVRASTGESGAARGFRLATAAPSVDIDVEYRTLEAALACSSTWRKETSMNEIRTFDAVLRELLEVRSADEDLHRRDSSLAERTASRKQLETLRDEMARIRASIGIDANVAGLHDSRMRRWTSTT